MAENLLELRNLTREFKIGGMILGTKIQAVDNVNISLPSDKPWIMSIVGESGSGKTTLARMILRLLDETKGDILIDGVPLKAFDKNETEFLKTVQPIFQNPFTAFSMRKTVDTYLYETALNIGIAKNRNEATKVITDVLKSVNLELENVIGKYPNQFSGGELQRVSIARALITKPKIIVADEPVAMIDASLRMNIVNIFKKLKDEYQVNFVYITHDLSTAYYISDYIAAMYKGSLIEFGDAKKILENPSHPYTILLLDSIPKVGARWRDDKTLKNLDDKHPVKHNACKFVDRCHVAQEACFHSSPEMVAVHEKHHVLCHNPQ